MKKYFFKLTTKHNINFLKIKDLYKKIFFSEYFKKVYKNIELSDNNKEIKNVKCIQYDSKKKKNNIIIDNKIIFF